VSKGKDKQRTQRAIRRQLAREESERFQRMSPAEKLEFIRFEYPVHAHSSWEPFNALKDRWRPIGPPFVILPGHEDRSDEAQEGADHG
jgi:hypothetical protein